MTLEELENEMPVTIKVNEAASIMGVSGQFLRHALMQGKLPFGIGVKMNQNEFYINTLRFIKYMKGENF